MDKFLTIEEAIDSGVIPESYAEMFLAIKKCTCGYDVIINPNATVLKCSNINCIHALAGRAEVIYKKFGLVGYGQIELEKFIYSYGIKDIYDVLTNPPILIKAKVDEWLNSKHTAVDILKMMNLPGLGVNCEKVFNEISTFEDFIKSINNLSWFAYFRDYGVSFRDKDLKIKELTEKYYQQNGDFELIKQVLLAQKGITIVENTWEEFNDTLFKAGLHHLMEYQFNYYGTNDGIMVDKVTDILYTYWDDIVKVFKRVQCYVDNREPVYIVITGDIVLTYDNNGERFKEKEDYVNYLNTQCEDLNIKFILCSKLKTAPFIVADYESSTRKYMEGIRTGRLYNSLEILNAVRGLSTVDGFKGDISADKKIQALKLIINSKREK